MSRSPLSARPQQLRRLLPAGALPLPTITRPLEPRAPSSKQLAACVECRKQKTRCSGDRPTCQRCASRQLDCRFDANPGETPAQARKRGFDDLRENRTAAEQVVELLRESPDSDAQVVLRKLRDGDDSRAIVDHFTAGNLLIQMAVSPETRFRYDLPYHAGMPEDFVGDNPYLGSLIYEAVDLYGHDQVAHSSQPSSYIDSRPKDSLSLVQHRDLYLKPYHAAHVTDPGLNNIRPSLWTSVSDDHALMCDLLGLFLRSEYHSSSAFQKDLFFDDMAAQRHDFCSSMLVNVVLAYACYSYPRFVNRNEYWNPHTLSYRFFAEGKRLWELEKEKAKLTTISADIIIQMIFNLCGLDEVGQMYRQHALSSAQNLRLFDDDQGQFSDRMRDGRAFTAWALFNWESLMSFCFMFHPELDMPPPYSLPEPIQNRQWYGEIWLKYPLNQGLSPSYFGHVFRAKCRFRIIMHQFTCAAYSDLDKAGEDEEGGDMAKFPTVAKSLHEQLTHWFEALPEPLQPHRVVLPSQLQLHLNYHQLLTSIYARVLTIDNQPNAAAQEIIRVSNRNYQTLLRLYYIRHGFEAMDVCLVTPLMVTGFRCIERIDESPPPAELEYLRATLMLVAKGLCDQRHSHYLADALFRVLKGRMRPEESSLIPIVINTGRSEADDSQPLQQTIRSSWPVAVIGKKDDKYPYLLKNLVLRFT